MHADKKELRVSRGKRDARSMFVRLSRVRLSSLSAPEEKDVRENRRPSYGGRALGWAQLFSTRNNYELYYTHPRMIFQCFSATISKRSKLSPCVAIWGDILCWRTNRTASRTHLEISQMRRPKAEFMKLSNMQCRSLFDKGTHEQRSRVTNAGSGRMARAAAVLRRTRLAFRPSSRCVRLVSRSPCACAHFVHDFIHFHRKERDV